MSGTFDAAQFGIQPPSQNKGDPSVWTQDLIVDHDDVLHWLYSTKEGCFYGIFRHGTWKIERFKDRTFLKMICDSKGRMYMLGASKNAICLATSEALPAVISGQPTTVSTTDVSFHPVAGRADQKPYQDGSGTETDRARQIAALDAQKFKFVLNGHDVEVRQWGKGSKGIAFFNHTGKMGNSIANQILTYRPLLNDGYSLFVWSYPNAKPFGDAQWVANQFRPNRPSAPLAFSGVASAVVDGIRAKAGIRSLVLVGNSMGAGVILWDYPKLSTDPDLRFLLISPTQPFSPESASLLPLQNSALYANEQGDPFVGDPAFKSWISANKMLVDPSNPLPAGHLILGQNLPHARLIEWIRAVQEAPKLKAAAAQGKLAVPQ